MIFYQGGKIDNGTHVPEPVAKQSTESEYNEAFTAVMALAHLSILINELLNNDPDIVTEEEAAIILDSVSAACMANNGKDTNQTRHSDRRVHFVRNGEK